LIESGEKRAGNPVAIGGEEKLLVLVVHGAVVAGRSGNGASPDQGNPPIEPPPIEERDGAANKVDGKAVDCTDGRHATQNPHDGAAEILSMLIGVAALVIWMAHHVG
jgi:hypothetical protein